MKYLFIALLLVASGNILAQNLVPYTDSTYGFTLSVPQWRELPQGSGSGIHLYLYDSSSALDCTAQTFLMISISKNKDKSLARAFARWVSGRKGSKDNITVSEQGTIPGKQISWLVSQDSAVCRPGELDYKIVKDYIIFVIYQKPYTIVMTCSAADLPAQRETFMNVARSYTPPTH